MRAALIVTCVAALCLGATTAFAGTQDNAVIALHAEPHPLKGGDPCVWDGSDCSMFVTEWPVSSSADLYLIVAKGDPTTGIAAASCGVTYGGLPGGLAVYSWTFCASGLQFPNNDGVHGDWPDIGGGNRMTWDGTVDCQVTEVGLDGVHALAGSFYVYAYGPDVFAITMNNNLQSGPEYQVGDCNNSITDLTTPFASVVFDGAVPGCNPCTGVGCAVPVMPSTWGKIKTQY